MRLVRFRKWLMLIGTGACMFQAAPGCPNLDQIKGVAATSTQSLVNGVIGLYVKNVVNAVFGV